MNRLTQDAQLVIQTRTTALSMAINEFKNRTLEKTLECAKGIETYLIESEHVEEE